MGIGTRIYQLEKDLAINIPSQVLPPSRLQLVEERVETPGILAQTTAEYYVLVRPYTDRTAILLTPNIGISPAKAMSNLGLNPDKPIFIRLMGTREWIQAHHYHGYYGRVWIPRYLARETGLRKQAVYPVFIRGTTFPHVEIRMVRREVKEVIVAHMEKTYDTENYAVNKWRWRIPNNIESYPVLAKALAINVYPEAECHLKDGAIFVDFVFSKAAARIVSETIGFGYRNSAVRNYTCTEDVSYPFLAEIRCIYYTSTPKSFYQTRDRHLPMKQALEITVYNLLQYFFNPAKKGQKYSTMSYAEHIGKIDFTTTRINLRRRYSKILDVPPIIVPGEEFEQEDREIKQNFYTAIKYVRVLNEQTYKRKNPEMYVYTDADINAMLLQKMENRTMQGLPQLFTLDENGFLWRIYEKETLE